MSSKPGNSRASGSCRLDIAHLQPLSDEIVHEPRRPPVGQHAAHLLREHGWILQLAARGDVEELVIGDALPEEERQPRGQLQIAQPIGGPWRGGGRLAFDAEQELRQRQQRFQGALDARIEVALAAAFPVDVEQRLDIALRHGPPVRAPRQRADDLPRARLFVSAARRAADENPPPARRVLRHLPLNGPEIWSVSKPTVARSRSTRRPQPLSSADGNESVNVAATIRVPALIGTRISRLLSAVMR